MNRLRKISLGVLPVLGLGLGLLYAYLAYYGFLSTWNKVGNPGERVEQILGFQDGQKILVVTESGQRYALPFFEQGSAALTSETAWEREPSGEVRPVRPFRSRENIVSLPPLFPVREQVELDYLYRVEGVGKVRFALAEDGNVWFWYHQIAGLTGLVFYFFPVIGFLAGIAVGLLLLIWKYHVKYALAGGNSIYC